MEQYKNIPQFKNKTCVAIGKFDGVHLGHVTLLEELVLISELNELESVVLTFDPFPEEFFMKKEMPRINTKGEIISEMEEIGIDNLVRVSFDEEFAKMKPEDFVKKILADKLKAAVVVCGEDVSFGCEGSGNLELLNKLGKKFGFSVEVVEKVVYNENDISSTGIIKALSEGRTEDASEMLGYDYYLYGPVLEGKALGREFGFPTANINPTKGRLIPKKGVYFTVVETKDSEYNAVTNVGIRPTVSDEGNVNIESYLLTDEKINLYNERIKVYFLHYLRDEIKFAGEEELFGQIKEDVEKAKRFFA